MQAVGSVTVLQSFALREAQQERRSASRGRKRLRKSSSRLHGLGDRGCGAVGAPVERHGRYKSSITCLMACESQPERLLMRIEEGSDGLSTTREGGAVAHSTV